MEVVNKGGHDMKRKMLFIRPPSLEMGDVAKTRNIHYGTIPYGVLSIIAYVNKYKKNDVDLDILDLNIQPWGNYEDDEFDRKVSDYISAYQPDIVGISVMYNHIYPFINRLSRIAKQINSDTIVIAGGACIMAYYQQILRECKNIDAICFSEGEIPVLNLVNSENMYDILENDVSFLTKNGLVNGKKPQAAFVDDLDDIPLVNF